MAVGRLIMLVRQRKQWRQQDLAAAAKVSRALVALAEAGAVERLTVRSLRRIAAPLEIRLPLAPRWKGGETDRLRDSDHAQLVEEVTTLLRRHGWEVVIEFRFSHYGERGSIDIVAWDARSRTLLVVEVKTRAYDVQALIAGLYRKARLSGQLLRADRGWSPLVVSRLVVLPELTANRSLVARHATVFQAAFPARSRAVRAWLSHPSGALSGLWFRSSANSVGGIQVSVGRQRVRVARGTSPRRVESRTANAVDA